MPGQNDIVLQVAAKAVILNNKGEVLIVREASTGKNNTQVGRYGIVGGRLDRGETFEDGLKREVMEEVGLEIEPIRPLHIGEWHPVIHGVQHQIIAVFMLCKAKTQNPKMSDEHDDFVWIKPSDRTKYKMMEPDCFVVDMVI